MMTFSLAAAGNPGRSLSLVKFVLPLDRDAFNLPRALAAIDAICHRGALAHEVVAVDDASPDGTATEARRFAHFMPLWLIQHTRPLGRAVAFRTGVEAACRDACDEDLLVPIDPGRWPDAGAALNAIVAARSGWDAVLTSAGRGTGRRRGSPIPPPLAVYRMGLVKRHLTPFLETPPGDDSEAVHQLDRYFLAAGITFFRLPAPLPAQPALRTAPDDPVSPIPFLGRAS
jgi:glycosyltransferase involved in cell wall biosynthesis